MVYDEADVYKKLENLARAAEGALQKTWLPNGFPKAPARDIQILPPEKHPIKKGLSYRQAQARLLHDLANI